MKPNIFSIATKELHQDAFIAWLLQWADPSNAIFDKQLHLCAQDFIRKLIGFPLSYEIKKVNAGRHWENIDVWAEVNDEYLLIIEDKTFTGEHSNQLLTYKSIAEEYRQENNFKLVCIYLKTGAEALSSLKKIESKGFNIFGRKEFLQLLTEFNDITNNIFTDFKDRLVTLEKGYNSFEDKVVNDWDDNDWVGFYQFLEKNLQYVSWSKVNNPNGGFWNAEIGEWHYLDDNVYSIYLQIEQGNLCFKICTDESEVDFDEKKMDRRVLRNQLHHLIMKKAKELNFMNIQRPDKFCYGNYMTIALVYKDKWLGLDDKKVEKNTVVMTLEGYISFLKEFADSMRQQQI